MPRYLAKSRILIQDERSTATTNLNANAGNYWEDPEPYFKTQYQILRGRGLARRVVRKLDLVHRGIPSADAGGLLSRLSSARASLSQTIRARVSPQPSGPPEAPARDETTEESAAINAFVGGIQVIPVSQTRLVDVSYDSPDPQFAALAVNTLVSEYIANNLDTRLVNTDETLDWLEQQVKLQQKAVEDAERAMAEYRTQQNAGSLNTGQNIVGSRLNQINDEATKAKAERIAKDANYQLIKDLTSASPNVEEFPLVAQNPNIQAIKTKLSSAQADLSREEELGHGANHPNYKSALGAVDEANRQLQIETDKVLEGIRNDYRAAVINEQNLSAALDQQKRESMDLDRKASTTPASRHRPRHSANCWVTSCHSRRN